MTHQHEKFELCQGVLLPDGVVFIVKGRDGALPEFVCGLDRSGGIVADQGMRLKMLLSVEND